MLKEIEIGYRALAPSEFEAYSKALEAFHRAKQELDKWKNRLAAKGKAINED